MNKNLVKIIRLIARLSSIIMILFMSIFFIGEGIIYNISTIKTAELFLLIFIPVTLFIGTFIALKKDLIGGIIISSSVVLFNIVDMIAFNKSIFFFNFLLCFIIGILFIIVGLNKK